MTFAEEEEEEDADDIVTADGIAADETKAEERTDLFVGEEDEGLEVTTVVVDTVVVSDVDASSDDSEEAMVGPPEAMRISEGVGDFKESVEVLTSSAAEESDREEDFSMESSR